MKEHKKRIYLYIIAIILVLVFIWGITKKPHEEKTNTSTNISTTETDKKCIDAVAYEMELWLNTSKNCLTEKVTMEIKNHTEKTVSELCIRDMTPEILKYCEENYSIDNKNLKTQIISISLKNSDETLSYKFGNDKSILYVQLDDQNTIKPNETAFITIQMKTDIPNREDRFGYRETEKGKLYALSFCFPYLADNDNGEWILDPFFDDGESRSSDLANYSVVFHAPDTYEVAISGNEKRENGTIITNAKNMRDFAIVACDFMKKDSFEVKGIQINNYYLVGEHADEYKRITKAVASDSISIFTEQIGTYPYKELDIVPCLFGFGYGGMEYPGLIMANASSYFDGPFRDAISLEDKISHEIAHQWFYAAVGNREYQEGWLDESFATLLEKDIYGLADCEAHKLVKEVEPTYPSLKEKENIRKEILDYSRELYQDIHLNVPPNEYPEEQSYGTAEYEGGYAFLQELRLLLGNDRFMDFVRDYYKEFYMKTVTTDELLNFIKKYNNSDKLNEIVRFYFR